MANYRRGLWSAPRSASRPLLRFTTKEKTSKCPIVRLVSDDCDSRLRPFRTKNPGNQNQNHPSSN